MSVAETKSNSQLFLDRLEKEILILDGAMGSMIYGLGLTEEQVRGERFKDWPHDLKNCTDVFGLTNPEAIVGLHRQYLDCLLYTSPSPRDKRQSRMPSSA